MRRITGKKIDKKNAASANTMGRFETQMLSVKDNLKALSEVNGQWVERALEKTAHRRIILDMDSSASPVHGEQEDSAYNGHFGCTCYHPILGEYFTPRHIVRSVIHLIKPTYGETIYDPFCGTGGFLLEAFKYLSLRVETKNHEILNKLKNETLYGRELTSTARISKMNMVLFGDGHSNVEQMDSLAHPINGKFDIAVSNIPYSQEIEEGHYYPMPSDKGDSVCLQHIWDSLKPNGRGAVIVPETLSLRKGCDRENPRVDSKTGIRIERCFLA